MFLSIATNSISHHYDDILNKRSEFVSKVYEKIKEKNIYIEKYLVL